MQNLSGTELSNRIYASQTSSWFGQIIQRSDDGGQTWYQPGSMDETSEEGENDTVYAGAEDAALFKTIDGGKTWKELASRAASHIETSLVGGRRGRAP